MFAYLQACRKQQGNGKHVGAQADCSADSMVLERSESGARRTRLLCWGPELGCAHKPDQLPFACVLLNVCTRGHCAQAVEQISSANPSWLVKQVQLQPTRWWIGSIFVGKGHVRTISECITCSWNVLRMKLHRWRSGSVPLLYLRSRIYPTHALKEGMHKFKFYLAFILGQREEKKKHNLLIIILSFSKTINFNHKYF